MRCPECKAENADDAEYCSLCYAKFKIGLRPYQTEEDAKRLKEYNEGSKLRCPNCGELSPLDAQFCLRCGFVFDDPASAMISEQEALEAERERAARRKGESEERPLTPFRVTPDVEGGALMRELEAALERGQRPRVQASGRDCITYAMKLLALLAGDLQGKGRAMRISAALSGEKPTVHLDDVELEMTLEIVREETVEG